MWWLQGTNQISQSVGKLCQYQLSWSRFSHFDTDISHRGESLKATARLTRTIQASKHTTTATVKDPLQLNTTIMVNTITAMVDPSISEGRILTTTLPTTTTGDDTGQFLQESVGIGVDIVKTTWDIAAVRVNCDGTFVQWAWYGRYHRCGWWRMSFLFVLTDCEAIGCGCLMSWPCDGEIWYPHVILDGNVTRSDITTNIMMRWT